MTKRSFGLEKILVVTLALSLLGGCGRNDTVYTDGNGVKIAGEVLVSSDGRALLPRGFYNQSVNKAVVDVWMGSTNYPYLRLRILDGTNAAGGFNGPGIGNRALVGLAQYDATLLATFDGVKFDFASDLLMPEVLLLVDLDCTGSVPRVLRADSSKLLPGITLEGGFRRLDATPVTAAWTTNLDITDPGSPSTVLLSTTTPKTLTDVIAAYPNACIRNSASFDLGMPKSLPTAGVLLSLGGTNNSVPSTVLIDRIEIGTDIYNDWEQL
ncbi:MAG: hypothetical protein AAB250_16520 [Bdellovibrionota bacterium]